MPSRFAILPLVLLTFATGSTDFNLYGATMTPAPGATSLAAAFRRMTNALPAQAARR